MPRPSDTWTFSQRRALIVVGVGFAVYIIYLSIQNPVNVTDPQPVDPPRALQLADRIDPNVAEVSTLAALPMIGERRARDIVDYRERVKTRDANAVAFASEDDLLKIRGIGAAMLSTLRPYLIFPKQVPALTTRPSAMQK